MPRARATEMYVLHVGTNGNAKRNKETGQYVERLVLTCQMGTAKKISDQQFLSVLRENAGLYARTARAIKTQFKIEYSRQAVRDRAESFPDELLDILEQNLDIAEEGLYSLMRTSNENVKLRAIELFLKTKGKRRGYIEKSEIDHNIKNLEAIEIKYIVPNEPKV